MKSKQNKKQNGKESAQQKDFKNLYANEKSSNISLTVLSKNLELENTILKQQNLSLNTELQALREKSDQTINSLQFHVSILKNRNQELMDGKREADIKYNTIKINYESLLAQYENYKAFKETEIQEVKKKAYEDKRKFANTLGEYENSIDNFEKLKQQKSDVQKQLELAKDRIKEIAADKDCEKILTVDAIKKEMTKKANQMKNKALQIRKEQLETTTRLTFLQNDQLIRELEYQTSNTEKILKRNTELEAQVKQLKQKIEIMNVVQNQIVKRNVFAKNLIKSMKQQKQNQPISTHKEVVQQKQNQSNKRKSKISNQKANKDIEESYMKIRSLEFIIHNLEKKIQNLQAKIHSQEETKKHHKQFNQQQTEKISEVIELLCHYFDILKAEQAKIGEQQEELNIERTKKLVTKLLSYIKPHLPETITFLKSIKKQRQKQYIDYGELQKQNIHVSKYISALKRLHQKNQNIHSKGRSLTNLTASFETKTSFHLKEIQKNKSKASFSINQGRINSKKFMKPSK